jgi:hypothetical protein
VAGLHFSPATLLAFSQVSELVPVLYNAADGRHDGSAVRFESI